MDEVWTWTAIAAGVYASLFVADAILKRIKARKLAAAHNRKVVETDDGRTSDCPSGTSTAE